MHGGSRGEEGQEERKGAGRGRASLKGSHCVRMQSDLQEPGQSSPAVTWFVCEVDLHLPQCTSFVDRLSGALGHAVLAVSMLTSVPTGECETQ